MASHPMNMAASEPQVVHVSPRSDRTRDALDEEMPGEAFAVSEAVNPPALDEADREWETRYEDHFWSKTKAMQQYTPSWSFGMCLGEVLLCILFLAVNAPFFTNAESVGKLIHFLTALVLLPITKRSVLLYFLNCPWERAIKYHRWVGRWILFVALVHSIWEMVLFVTDPEDDDEVSEVKVKRSGMQNFKDQSSESENLWGYIATGTLILFAVTSIPYFRRGCFWFFQRTHWILFPAYVASSLLHYSGGTLIVSMALPLVLWIVDVGLQFWQSWVARVTYVEVLPGDVVRMSFEKPEGFEYEAGDYLFFAREGLKGGLEWHPFTLSSSPEEKELTVHIRAYGRWTKQLYDDIAAGGDRVPKGIRLAGPYGVLSIPVHDHKGVLVLISGGIGCTPMMSIMKSLYIQGKLINDNIKATYFVWAVRDYEQLQWFEQDLDYIASQCPGFHVKLFVTRAPRGGREGGGSMMGFKVTNSEEVEEIAGGASGDSKAIPEPEIKRPDLPAIFSEVHAAHPNETVGVLTCGPKVLCQQALFLCNKYNRARAQHPFLYHTETFEI